MHCKFYAHYFFREYSTDHKKDEPNAWNLERVNVQFYQGSP